MDNNKDCLKFIIQRYDTYISNSNTKGSFLLSLNAVILTLCVSNLTKIFEDQAGCKIISIILVSILLASGIMAIVFVVRALYPFTSSGSSHLSKYSSNIFFGSVRKYRTPKEYWDSINSSTDTEFEEDMARQAYTLAVGLDKKFRFLKIASWFIYVDLFAIMGIFLNKIL
ncbi:Pycsar system effector family protein [Sphingobacterium sp.]|uniref:Pycsar system effector family protein n=1 Tax=Sphingobacterium sp. TaxID=341027 RepID=UPI0028A14EFC|nr:Pycsar system effector family protein [Sphingobacterium sp.]